MNCRNCLQQFPHDFEFTYPSLNGYCLNCQFHNGHCRSCEVHQSQKHTKDCKFHRDNFGKIEYERLRQPCLTCKLLVKDHKNLCNIGFRKGKCSFCASINDVTGECFICKKTFCLMDCCATMIRKDKYNNLYCTEICMNDSPYQEGMSINMCPFKITLEKEPEEHESESEDSVFSLFEGRESENPFVSLFEGLLNLRNIIGSMNNEN